MRMNTRSIFAAGTVLVLSAAPSFAAPITFTAAPDKTYQQTTNNPCVIGDTSCKEPVGMEYTVYSGTPGGDVYDSYSPSYTNTQLAGFLGSTSFIVGIDDNFSNTNETLSEFTVWYCASSCGTYDPNELDELSPVLGNKDTVLTAAGYTELYKTIAPFLLDTANGNGYADAISNQIDLDSLVGNFVFEGIISGDNDGMEEFFLIPATPPVSTVPEPASLLLLGTGLFGAAAARRKAKKQ